MKKIRGEKVENSDKINQDLNSLLVLSINKDGKIVHFNKNCEKTVGYDKNEVFDKETLDFLIPSDFRKQWDNMVKSVKEGNDSSDFVLPWLDKNGDPIMVSWDIAPIDSGNDKIGDIGLVGKILSKDIPKNNVSDKNVESKGNKNSEKIVFNIGKKKLVFNKKKSDSKNKKTSDKTNTKLENESDKNKKIDADNIVQNYDSDVLKKNFEDLNKKVLYLNELEDKNKALENENNKLSKEIDYLKNKLEKKKNQDKMVFNAAKDYFGKSVVFVLNIVNAKKKQEEFQTMMKELDDRTNLLKDIELNVNEDKKKINETRDELVKWREKLELLEDELEKRRLEVVEKEDLVKNNMISNINPGAGVVSNNQNEIEVSVHSVSNAVSVDDKDVFKDVDGSAAIVQRGILKEVNGSFADFIGFNVDELVEKSFFDFISPAGLSSVEKYYLDRLKGEAVGSYDTVFLTSDDREVRVQIDIKPVFYHGTLADRIVVLNNSVSSDDVNKNQDVKSDNGPEVKSDSEIDSAVSTSSPGGKMSQDDISAMMAKARGEEVGEKPKKAAVGGVPGVVTQDQISDMVKKAQTEKNENNEEPKEQKEKEDEKPVENESSGSAGGKMSQDDISAMFEKANTDKDKKEDKEED